MYALKLPAPPRQALAEDIQVLGEVLHEDVNLAVWQRRLPAQIADFAETLLAQGEPLAQSMTLELAQADSEPNLAGLVAQYADLPGQAAFLADVAWLVRAYACLLDAQRIGLRLRALDKAMCPRFHVDHVPLRLITSYAGVGSEWLEEGAMPRSKLGQPGAEPQDEALIQRLDSGHVALAKGEKWQGNEGRGLIHRSPQSLAGERRLLLTLDWLA
ncbi:DUF1826 domain-containing protein [Ectopseudomonas mendocina]|uniref:DUF1826 domain-containing protein n=1 Tax=Ectopseudomonas mendocina TaxID=300 RepID=A0ABD7S2Q0_ECTME|nr:DUF1826 domain-containing protein [Pseudomonas mendocina]TRO13428.1 DUF1826 domain-containing protein [Pseudomonas mendocina]TRO18808.1 DUF1826 domain-containing protein [Pseudomonas mendocina]